MLRFIAVWGLLGLFMVSACTEGGKPGEAGEVNVYSHRHYPVDEVLFKSFTDETGIKVNVISAGADELIKRLELEGADSPADLLFTVDAGRLNRATDLGLLQPVRSAVLDEVPAAYKDPAGHWYGLTIRARVITYAKDRVNPDDIKNYEDLADPKWKGKILMRSSENVYNQSLLASLVAANGEEAATEWAKAVVGNFARDPKGSDRDQTKAIASGEGDVSVSNTYYMGHLLNSENPEEVKAAEAVGIIFPNQDGRGTHINVSGIGVAKHAPNKENAIRLIEFLSRPESQKAFASVNYEYPVHPQVEWADILKNWGDFKRDALPFAELGTHNAAAMRAFDVAGWK